jgi:hypothetical protein
VEFYRRAAGLRILIALAPHRPKPTWLRRKAGQSDFHLKLVDSRAKTRLDPFHKVPSAVQQTAYGRRKADVLQNDGRNYTALHGLVAPISAKEQREVDAVHYGFAISRIEEANTLLKKSIESSEDYYQAMKLDEQTPDPRFITGLEEGDDGFDMAKSVSAVHHWGPKAVRTHELLRAVYRGYRTRKIVAMQQLEHVAAAYIQLRWMKHVQHRHYAATTIQIAFRGHCFREILAGCIAARWELEQAENLTRAASTGYNIAGAGFLPSEGGNNAIAVAIAGRSHAPRR